MDNLVFVDLIQQRLSLLSKSKVLFEATVSTGKNGIGELEGSGKTPRGWHLARAMIGKGLPKNSVLVSRRPTGEIYNQDFGACHPGRDWILSRIIWLSGLELGKNRLGLVDTMRRYIYIHGAPDELMVDRPGSHGCIRMFNQDIITLFDLITVGTKVYISDEDTKR